MFGLGKEDFLCQKPGLEHTDRSCRGSVGFRVLVVNGRISICAAEASTKREDQTQSTDQGPCGTLSHHAVS